MSAEKIKNAQTYLGIELGSTRIKACLTDDSFVPIADGSYQWENQFENGFWTYSLKDIHNGIQECFKDLASNVLSKFGVKLEKVSAMGISGMMHGYLAFDKDGNLLVPFRTWRNTTNEKASEKLSSLFSFNIPQRWSIAHLYQAILNNENHVKDVAYITTVAGYIHYLLTGKLEVGIGEASGIFPISGTDYDMSMIEKFDNIISGMYSKSIYEMLPKVKTAGAKGSFLTNEGAAFLDPDGNLKSGIPMCPPEGDAGTGMIATNAVKPKTGNVSAGTSIFAMLVLENQLKNFYPEVDVVTTPDGSPVAMIHCNNCTAEIDSWVNIFSEFASLMGMDADKSKIYSTLYNNTLNGDDDCGKVMCYNYLSGEHVTGVENGRPMYFRTLESNMNLANFIKSQLYSSMASLRIGTDILLDNEAVETGKITAHGGLFKVKGIAQQILANALNTPVSVMETAGEGGAWGMALLAAYMNAENITLGKWLDEKVFASMSTDTVNPDSAGVAGFENYISYYKKGIHSEKELGKITF